LGLNKEDERRTTRRTAIAIENGSTKRSYGPPRLSALGDLRDLTCGATGDNPESGGTFFTLSGV